MGVQSKDRAQRAATRLAAAQALAQRLHEPGVRDAYRAELVRIADEARQVLAEGVSEAARETLLAALSARAEDARYGAGQLSRGAQRAPTVAACEDGWVRVEEIVTTAEACAREARALASEGDERSRRWAQSAERSAWAARKVVDDRNHAYTFHADPGFSFGEGWYLGAAAVLARVPIQVEPDRPQTRQVRRFLHDAGLGPLVVSYRPRPRANKPLTEIVARGFRAGPPEAQRAVRAAFLGAGPLSQSVVDWADRRLEGAPRRPKVLLWVRYAKHHPDRNTEYKELADLTRIARAEGLTPVLAGDALRDGDRPPEGAVDWTLFWKQALFQGEDMRRAQLHLFEHLRLAHGLVGQIGVTTAGMDGPALTGLATMYLTAASNVRMREWVGAVPDYEEVVRGPEYLEVARATFERWRRQAKAE